MFITLHPVAAYGDKDLHKAGIDQATISPEWILYEQTSLLAHPSV